MPRPAKRAVLLAGDAVVLPIGAWSAISLAAGRPVAFTNELLVMLVVLTALSLPIFAGLGLYRAVLRYMGPRVVGAVASAVAGTVLVFLGMRWVFDSPLLTLPAAVIFGALALLAVGGGRMLLRWWVLKQIGSGASVVIYGAGRSGAALAAALAATRVYTPVAFVDDNRALRGTVVAGRDVFQPEELPRLLERFGVRRILLAMPSISVRRRREVLAGLAPLSVHVQTVPDIAALVGGTATVGELQEVNAADLLGRDPVPPNQVLLEACIRDKTVLVSGAGGSIGSELCRQIIRLAPRRLLLLEMSELALYNIDRELRAIVDVDRLGVEVVPLLGNAHHKYRVREILQTFGVQTIYHAAAYKHVPIVEQNVIEGLHNNVFSTWYAAEAALECHVETFVLISTDKAVNPTNVMGATKRFAEIVLQGLQQRGSGTRFCMVRFGNVLESSGSVVPLFREQIRRGGPVTVTHPDVIRYFMTIPEAAQLVLQAGAMATGGDVFVLDMGKPIRIADLATRMIQLSGLVVKDAEHPEGDIEIRFTGLRPAEKLFEELLIGKNVMGTEHPMILRAVEHGLPWDQVHALLEELGVAMRRFDCRAARDVLERAVIEYRASADIQDLVWVRRAPAVETLAVGDSKVRDLHPRRQQR